MSKLLLSPNYCSCTVNRARNLPDKGKSNGLDAFCTISMGKDKFVTAVAEKTIAPEWNEQCDMTIVDDAIIKLTVYNNSKNSLSKGDFIGRAYVPLRDLQDYDRVHTKWYKLTNKDGKLDKDRGEIEVTLQFYSKNNTTGSVLDLATKKKHLSLKDIKHSLSDRLKPALKHRTSDKYAEGNQLADQRRRLGGDNKDFLDDSASETTSFAGSHLSLNSMSYNNNGDQHKKKSRLPPTETPRSSRRSVTSDYETSSILDSASMYGGDEPSIASSSVRSQVAVDENSSPANKTPSSKKKNKAPIPTIITTKPNDSPLLTEHKRIDDDNNNNKSKEFEITSKQDTLFGLTTIKENLDTDENLLNNRKNRTAEEIDFDNYFKEHEEKKPKKPAPVIQQTKEQRLSSLSHTEDIRTPSTSISVQIEPNTNPFTNTKQSDKGQDSTDEDVDELLGKLERMSSMRSSVKRKVQPRNDSMEQPATEVDNNLSRGSNQTPSTRNRNTALPDIVGPQSSTNSSPLTKKPPTGTGLSVLGYDNVKSVPINQKVRQELDYLDREELLHVIAYQLDLIKKRDIRLKDLEQYTDSLLVKIVEQCPSILQVGSSSKR